MEMMHFETFWMQNYSWTFIANELVVWILLTTATGSPSAVERVQREDDTDNRNRIQNAWNPSEKPENREIGGNQCDQQQHSSLQTLSSVCKNQQQQL